MNCDLFVDDREGEWAQLTSGEVVIWTQLWPQIISPFHLSHHFAFSVYESVIKIICFLSQVWPAFEQQSSKCNALTSSRMSWNACWNSDSWGLPRLRESITLVGLGTCIPTSSLGDVHIRQSLCVIILEGSRSMSYNRCPSCLYNSCGAQAPWSQSKNFHLLLHGVQRRANPSLASTCSVYSRAILLCGIYSRNQSLVLM